MQPHSGLLYICWCRLCQFGDFFHFKQACPIFSYFPSISETGIAEIPTAGDLQLLLIFFWIWFFPTTSICMIGTSCLYTDDVFIVSLSNCFIGIGHCFPIFLNRVQVSCVHSIQVTSLSICLMNRTSSELLSFSFHSNLNCQFSSPCHTASQQVMYTPFSCPPPTTMAFQLRY